MIFVPSAQTFQTAANFGPLLQGENTKNEDNLYFIKYPLRFPSLSNQSIVSIKIIYPLFHRPISLHANNRQLILARPIDLVLESFR